MTILTARSLRSLKHAKDAKKDRQGMSLFGPPGQPNPGFLCVLCASVVNDFTTHSLALVRGTEITEQLFFGPPGQQRYSRKKSKSGVYVIPDSIRNPF